MSKIGAVVICALFVSASAFGDVIKMKNGDVYRADVLKEEFGSYVQILLKDGSEKRLQWATVETIERSSGQTPAPTSALTPISRELASVSAGDQSQEYPSEMLNDRDPFRLEVDLIAFSYDSTWQKASIQATGSSSSTSLSATNRYVRTAPVEFGVAAYFNRWHAYLNYYSAATNTNDLYDSSFATFAFTYGFTKSFDLGLFLRFDYANTSASNSSSSASVTGSSYAFGPFIRIVAPVSDIAAIEISAGAGLDFRSLTIGTSSASLTGSDTGFLAIARLGTSVSISKHFSYLFWVDGSINLGTLDGTEVAGQTTTTGTLQDDIYRLRVVPVGLRLKF